MWRVSVRPSTESGLQPVDVVVDARTGATVRDLAVALGEHLAGPGSRVLLVPTTDGVPWSAATPLSESDLRPGDLLDVAVVTPEWLDRPGRPRPARATARVVAGPDAGLAVRVESDALTIGRASSCTLRLSDPDVSRLHARVLLVGGPVVVDEGSAHGTRIGDTEVVRPRPVAWGEQIRLGGTVVVLEEGTSTPADAGEVLRPPRFGESLDAAELEVPAPPAAPRSQPLPWPMVLMPLLLGGGMFAMTRSPFSLMFMIGFPVMLIAGHLMQRRHQRKEHAEELGAWREEVTEVIERLDDAAALQRHHAAEDEPEADVLRAHVLTRHRALWNRRTDDDDFLAVRTGLGPRPAVVTATVASGGDRVQRELARKELTSRATLADLPVPLPIGAHGLVAVTSGVRGADAPDDVVDAVVRSFVLRLAAHHSPSDVTLTAVLSPARLHLEAWARWLPHTARRAGGVDPVAVGAGPGQELLELLLATEPAEDGAPLGPRTVCLVDEDAGVPRRLVEALAAAGPARGVHVVWLGADPARVPSSTGVLVDLAERRLMRRDRGGTDLLTHVDRLGLVDAWRLARSLTACTDEAAVVPAETAVPDQVRLPDLGADLADPDDVTAILDRWSAARGLRAQLGAGADGVVTIDLREDGPHGLVAGTTGSGKSELLQSLLCSLALNNPPSRITFLLVDYKGGAAFRECADLPHTVGYITDLTPALVQRALISLNAELTRREHVLAEHGAKDLLALERMNPEAAPPSMLICVDEFAALLAEVPEFVDGMVNIAQRGRSLGMHMLLATQRPAGVVTPQIKANTDLRIALRMASTEDSQDVIDSSDAARLSRRTPGRAWLRRTGHGTRELVQVAFVGAHEPVREQADRVTVRAFAARTLAAEDAATGVVHPSSDLERLVLATGSAFARSGAQQPLRPWLPPLADVVELAPGSAPGEVLVGSAGTAVTDEAAVPGSTDGVRHRVAPATLVLGLVDRPAQQRQEPLVVDYGRAGHLLVYGASGSGKTELLRTVAAAASLADEPAPAVVYGLDAGGGALTSLEQLPSVGSVVVEQAGERLQRLLRMLHRTVLERNALLAARGAVDLSALHAAGVALPRIHVLVDNLPALLDSLEGGGPLRRGHVDMLLAVLQEGRRCGVHVTATSPRRTGVPSAMQSAFGQRLVLRMTADDDYQMLGVPEGVIDADSAAGRGLWGRDEAQVARLAGGSDALAAHVADRYAAGPAVPVPGMPTRLPADLMPTGERDELHLAVEAEYAGAVSLRLADAPLLVTGRDGSGRTSTLAGIAQLAAASSQPPVRTVVIGPRAETLAALVGSAERVTDGDEGGDVGDGECGATSVGDVAAEVLTLADPEAAARWVEAVLTEPAPSGDAWSLVLVDDVHEWERAWEAMDARRTAVERLADLAGRARDLRLALVVTTDPDDARSRQHVPGVSTAVRRSRRAVLLQPEMADGGLAGVTVPMHSHEPLTGPGRGILATAGSARVVQLVSATFTVERV